MPHGVKCGFMWRVCAVLDSLGEPGRCAGFILSELQSVRNPTPLAVQRRYARLKSRQKDEGDSDYYATNPGFSLVPEKGVEPSTFALRMRCSTN